MGKASNKQEDSIRLSGLYYSSNSSNSNNLKQVVKPSYDVIRSECNKPLQSKFYVNANNRARYEWKYNSDKHYGVYKAIGNLWLCRDRKQSTISDCEREQIKLYNRLKREYEREQKLLKDKEVSETVVTAEDKARARAQKIAYNLNWYNIDKMYGIQRKL